MSKAFWFWFLLILWIVFAIVGYGGFWAYAWYGNTAVLLILLALLGLKVFGSPIQD